MARTRTVIIKVFHITCQLKAWTLWENPENSMHAKKILFIPYCTTNNSKLH